MSPFDPPAGDPAAFFQPSYRVSRERLGITAEDRLFASSRLFFSYPQTNSLWAGLKLMVGVDPKRSYEDDVATVKLRGGRGRR